jgi:uncharacterized hydrophobic protein (TIGR00271 family)
MLISPLMGPIVGVGLAIGINDFTMLMRSLKSLGTAVGISIFVSAIYFLLTPFGDVQAELIARTKPTLLDVLIAIFSGIALIVAKTKKGTIVSVILGVAISTALMPPLCTAGYGLANLNWKFFLGAFYLFLINSVFIAFSTWLIIKYLRFPLAQYVNKEKQKRVKRYIYIISLLIIIPSGITFWRTIKENIFINEANRFIADNFNFDNTWITKETLKYNAGDTATIELFLMGDILPPQQLTIIKKKMPEYDLEDTKLVIHQLKDNSEEIAGKLTAEVKTSILEELYRKNQELLNDKEKYIHTLENELLKIKSDTIPFNAIKKEVHIQYPDIEKLSFGKTVSTDFTNQQDTIPLFFVKWHKTTSSKTIEKEKEALEKWLRVRLNDEHIKVVSY